MEVWTPIQPVEVVLQEEEDDEELRQAFAGTSCKSPVEIFFVGYQMIITVTCTGFWFPTDSDSAFQIYSDPELLDPDPDRNAEQGSGSRFTRRAIILKEKS